MKRSEIFKQIKALNKVDLLVIGGGATGCGIALDAANRGLSVILVEQNDFAEGTSGRSSKLVHGGVRYLEMAVKRFDRQQFALVKEGLHERYYFLRNAPHLSQALPLISPLYSWWQMPQIWIGLKLYDLLAGKHGLGPSGYFSYARTVEECPLLQRKNLKGGVRYYDGQFNDSRMALSLALTAAEQGALIANHLKVVDLVKEKGKLTGAVLDDQISGDRFSLQATAVVNATGPFGDTIRWLDQSNSEPLLTVSSGVHIVLDGSYLPPKSGLLLTETEDGRVLFLLPWQGRCLIGTTDNPAELSEHPAVSETDIDYLLRHLKNVLDPPPNRENVTASWSGLRPLVIDPQAKDTARILRDFIIEESVSGLFTIVGGKWTSYRRMAEKLIDQVIKSRQLTARPCNTTNLPIVGAIGWQPLGWKQLVDNYPIDEVTARYLHANYGSCATKVLTLVNSGWDKLLIAGFPCLAAEVIYACQYELVEHAVDMLVRRLPMALLDNQLAKVVAARVVDLMSAEKGWDAKRRVLESELLSKRLQQAL